MVSQPFLGFGDRLTFFLDLRLIPYRERWQSYRKPDRVSLPVILCAQPFRTALVAQSLHAHALSCSP